MSPLRRDRPTIVLDLLLEDAARDPAALVFGEPEADAGAGSGRAAPGDELGIRRVVRRLARLCDPGGPLAAAHARSMMEADLPDFDRDLLTAIGDPRPLPEISLALGVTESELRGRLGSIAVALKGRYTSALEQAEMAARRAAVCYAEWKLRNEMPQPVSDAQPDDHRVLAMIEAKSERRALSLPPIHPTDGPARGDTAYSLRINESEWAGQWRTNISFFAPGSGPSRVRWAVRLFFDPEDERRALAARDLKPLDLGVLRATFGEDRWSSLLDLLLPARFCSTEDPLHAQPTRAGGVAERLPGWPRRARFWVDPGEPT